MIGGVRDEVVVSVGSGRAVVRVGRGRTCCVAVGWCPKRSFLLPEPLGSVGGVVEWVLVEVTSGGVGPLWWARTPITCGDVGRPGGDLPLVGLTWEQAREVSEAVGARLPAVAEWDAMVAGRDGRRFPWGDMAWTPRRANLRGSGHGRALPVGSFPAGVTAEGLHDVAGNVWEWTADRLPGDAAYVVGGSYNSLPLYAQHGYHNDVPIGLVSPGIGLRVVRDP